MTDKPYPTKGGTTIGSGVWLNYRVADSGTGRWKKSRGTLACSPARCRLS